MARPRTFLTRIASAVRGAVHTMRSFAFGAPEIEADELAPAPTLLTTMTRMTVSADAVTEDEKPHGVRSFNPTRPMPGVLPHGTTLANDSAMDGSLGWAAMSAMDEGLSFMGYPYLAQLTQRPEYRRPSEILAREMTRRWIRFQATGDQDKTEILNKIEAEFERLGVQDLFRAAAEDDGFFGRSQLYIDVGAKTDQELAFPLSASKLKIAKGAKIRLKKIEPMWTYPDAYNSTDPLRDDFYKPTSWFVSGRRVHASRLMTFVSRDVPDILKANYSFGGLSLSQIAKPYVDNWLRTRQSVSDAIHSFSVMVLMTNMGTNITKAGADTLRKRARLFNQFRDNLRLLVVDKEHEDFKNVSMPLSGLDHLQAQSQEHMSAVTGIPLVILLGITPTGLNASSDGELKAFYAWIEATQRTLFGPHLKKLLDIVQLALFGEIDPEIGFEFEPLQVLSDVEQATVRKTEADTDGVLIDKGIIDPHEARVRVASDEDSPYAALDLTVDPAPPVNADGGEGEGDDGSDGEAGDGGSAAGGDDFQEPKPTPGAVAPVAAQDADTVRPRLNAAGIMFRAPDGSVLLLKRGKGGDHGGEWCFPGGKVESGETPEQAAWREAREEVGKFVPRGPTTGMLSDEAEGVHFTTFINEASKAFQPALNDEHTAYLWARTDALPTPMHPGPLATIAQVCGVPAQPREVTA